MKIKSALSAFALVLAAGTTAQAQQPAISSAWGNMRLSDNECFAWHSGSSSGCASPVSSGSQFGFRRQRQLPVRVPLRVRKGHVLCIWRRSGQQTPRPPDRRTAGRISEPLIGRERNAGNISRPLSFIRYAARPTALLPAVSKIRRSAAAPTFIFEPSLISPPSSFSASGSCSIFWIARFRGRAPKAGS